MKFTSHVIVITRNYDCYMLHKKAQSQIRGDWIIELGGDYMIPVSQDEILPRFARIPAVL